MLLQFKLKIIFIYFYFYYLFYRFEKSFINDLKIQELKITYT